MALFLTVNAEGVKRFQAFASLSEEQFDQVLAALRTSGTTFGKRSEIWDFAKRNVPENSEALAYSIEAVWPLLVSDEYEGTSADELSDAVVAAIERTPKGPEFSPDHKSAIKSRLARLLSDSATRLLMKTWGLVIERPTVLKKARIITDVRPVFGDGKQLEVEAASVIHSLVLSCTKDSETTTMHVALDAADLVELKAAIERAQAKESLLVELTARAGVKSVQIK